MELTYKLKRGQNYIELRYKKPEWEKLKGIYESELHLNKSRTVEGFHEGVALEYYQDTEGKLRSYLQYKLASAGIRTTLTDAINSPIIDDSGRLNIAVLRAVPKEERDEYVTTIPIRQNIEVENYGQIAPMIKNVMSATQDKLYDVKINFEEREPML